MLFALTTSTWDSLSDGASLMVVATFIVAGILLGYALRGLVGRWQAESIEKQMKLREDEAESEIRSRLKEADIAARAAVVKAREEFEASVKSRRAELKEAEDRQIAREANLDRKASALDERSAKLDAKHAEVEAAAKAAKESARTAEEKNAAADARLQTVAEMTHLEARREMLSRANEQLRTDAAGLSRRIQEAAREQGDAIARRIVADAVHRCAVVHLNDLATATVSLPNAEMKGRIVGRDGRNVRALEAATGVNLLLDDVPDMVVLSAFDPQRREIARCALEKLVANGRIHPSSIEEAVAAAKEETETANDEAGATAAAEAGVSGLSPEILRLMGSLRLRTSFTQNVLRHSVEVALLTGVMAAEMGLDAAMARRTGFLHDIGKALTTSAKGAHAALGADFLRSHGESETVCRAVAAHHAEAGTDGGVLGVLCAAADAISSARPGARHETAESYVERMGEIESIARSHAGVQQVFAVQAGRDLRVVVDPGQVDDGAAVVLARDICRDISARVRFPGQIRVTVIRELRCTEYAK